jgi:cell division septation protein DedD
MSKKQGADSIKWTLVIILIIAGAITGYTLIQNQLKVGKQKAEKQEAIDSIMGNFSTTTDTVITAIDSASVPVDTQPTLKDTTVLDTAQPAPQAIQKNEYVIVLASLSNLESANKALLEYQKSGLNVRIIEANVKEKKYYRVCVLGFNSKQMAQTTLDSLKKIPQYKDAWILWAWF